jgi:hypothetical protein
VRAIGIVNAAVARTHEEVGLREPSHRTSQVCAIDGKNLEGLPVQISNPARNICRLSIPRIGDGIPKCSEPGLAYGKLFQSAKREPPLITRLPATSNRRENVT